MPRIDRNGGYGNSGGAPSKILSSDFPIEINILTMLAHDDKFSQAPLYKSGNIAPIADWVLARDLSSDYRFFPERKPFAAYLQKAVEVVRRDPYCTLVKSVGFSPVKNKAGEYVVYVSCDRGKNRSMTKELAISDIDIQYGALGLSEDT